MSSDNIPQWRSRLNKLAEQFDQEYLPKLKQVANRAVTAAKQVDTKLEQSQYGDRYINLKQEVESARSSYANTKTKVKSGYTEATVEGSAEPYPRAAKFGATVAKGELTLRQQLKKLLLAIADRL
ncbi:MAG: hypothetical protein VKJ64_20745 [Leptolyngbyaceae bacterium]|nr:hypothetical protein [Leptolyngbyaceae bacterium]